MNRRIERLMDIAESDRDYQQYLQEEFQKSKEVKYYRKDSNAF